MCFYKCNYTGLFCLTLHCLLDDDLKEASPFPSNQWHVLWCFSGTSYWKAPQSLSIWYAAELKATLAICPTGRRYGIGVWKSASSEHSSRSAGETEPYVWVKCILSVVPSGSTSVQPSVAYKQLVPACSLLCKTPVTESLFISPQKMSTH